jgi:diguanylate cyclase
MTGATSPSASPQHGLTDRLARWAKGLSGKPDDEASAEEQRPRPGSASSREVNRRRHLYGEIGDFLFAHDLDLTPINFSVALI